MRTHQLTMSILLAVLFLNAPGSASAANIEVYCVSGAYPIGGTGAPAPTTWCSMAWGPSGPIVASTFSLNATFAALAFPGATATGTRWCYGPCQPSGTLGPIIITCSTITSAIDANATAVGWNYHPEMGYTPVLVAMANYLGSIVPNSPPVPGCIPVL